jgi:transketolase C-terminal domain/subunit
MLNPELKLNEKIFENPEYKAIRDGFGDGLLKIEDKNIVVLTCDVKESTRVHKFFEKFPDRFFECGISEQNMAVIASGLADSGKIPFISSYSVFSPGRNWEQIRTMIAYNNSNVKIAGHHTGIVTGEDGVTHHATEDIGIMRALPNMKIISPCDYYEAVKATIESAKIKGPVYLRLSRPETPIITTEETPFRFGKIEKYWIPQKNADYADFTQNMQNNNNAEYADLTQKKQNNNNADYADLTQKNAEGADFTQKKQNNNNADCADFTQKNADYADLTQKKQNNSAKSASSSAESASSSAKSASVAIFATGHLVYQALLAAKELEEEGIYTYVLNVHTIKPLDIETILEVAGNVDGIVTVEDHQVACGLGSAISEVLLNADYADFTQNMQNNNNADYADLTQKNADYADLTQNKQNNNNADYADLTQNKQNNSAKSASSSAKSASSSAKSASSSTESAVRVPPIIFIGLKDTFAESGNWEDLIKKYKLDKEAIKEAVKKLFRDS